jgi:hypothetical protein
MSEGIIPSFNPAKRRLCPDGACIGVIGDDGRCRVCGTGLLGGAAGATTAASASSAGQPDDSDRDQLLDGPAYADPGTDAAFRDDGGEAGTAREAAGIGVPGTGESALSAFRADRKLCDDGSCVGVIGPDGRCPVCGRRAES